MAVLNFALEEVCVFNSFQTMVVLYSTLDNGYFSFLSGQWMFLFLRRDGWFLFIVRKRRFFYFYTTTAFLFLSRQEPMFHFFVDSPGNVCLLFLSGRQIVSFPSDICCFLKRKRLRHSLILFLVDVEPVEFAFFDIWCALWWILQSPETEEINTALSSVFSIHSKCELMRRMSACSKRASVLGMGV